MSEILLGIVVGSVFGYLGCNARKNNNQTQNIGNSSVGVQVGRDSSELNKSIIKTMKDEIFNITGDNIIANSKITVDGKVIFDNTHQTHKVSIIVDGDCETVKTSTGEVEIKGVAGSVTTSLGNVYIGGTVSGNVETTLGNVKLLNGDIVGNVKTTLGNVRCK